jgi:hypothetical protein
MKVTHAVSRWTLRKLLQNSVRYRSDVTLFKQRGEFPFRAGPVLHPRLFWMTVFPPLMPVYFYPWLRTREDWLFLGPSYAYLVALRLQIWSEAWKERVLVI